MTYSISMKARYPHKLKQETKSKSPTDLPLPFRGTGEEEKCLSLLQPWASLVIMGFKKIETRSWSTAYRGSLLIHASLGRKGKVLATEPPFSKYIRHFDSLPFGAIIGRVQLIDILPVEDLFYSDAALATLTLEEKAFGDYTKGRYAWLLEEPEAFEDPIPIKGTLGLWSFKPA
jgi:hypothetical protein